MKHGEKKESEGLYYPNTPQSVEQQLNENAKLVPNIVSEKFGRTNYNENVGKQSKNTE